MVFYKALLRDLHTISVDDLRKHVTGENECSEFDLDYDGVFATKSVVGNTGNGMDGMEGVEFGAQT